MSGDVAVVGMSAVFPQASDLLGFWSNIVNGRSCITELPADRWEGHAIGDTVELIGLTAPAIGGFVDTEFEFDAFRHGVLPNAVKGAGPEQFVMLETVASALDDAGISGDDPRRSRTDLFVGQGGFGNIAQARILHGTELQPLVSSLIGESDRAMRERLLAVLPDMSPSEVETAVPNFTANATAKRLDLRGVAYTLDAACASSLVSVELGVDRLRNKRCDIAVAAGGHFGQNPIFWYVMAALGALSMEGQIRPFDRAASGLVPGEGAGAVVLKRLADAVADGDEIYAVVKGTGSSSDGRGKGLFAPSSDGQRLALERAYADAEVSPDTIGLLEAHGTATPIGDAAEAETIRLVYGERAGSVPARAMGSVKSMIGHTMPAAGVAGFIKATLALTHKVLPPSLNCTDPIDSLDDLPFYVNTEARPWVHRRSGEPRRAAVNAFGFGGVNGHVVLEEVPDPKATAAAEPAPLDAAPIAVQPARPRPVLSVTERPTELLVFSGESSADIAAQLDAAADHPDHANLEGLARALAARADSSEPTRLAVSVAQEDDVPTRLRALASEIRADREPSVDDRVEWGTGEPGTRATSLLFGGAGLSFDLAAGDYLLERALHFPATLRALDALQPDFDPTGRPLPWNIELSAPAYLDTETRVDLLADLQAPREGDLSDLMMWGAANRVRGIAQYSAWIAVSGLEPEVEALLAVSLGEFLSVSISLGIPPEELLDRVWAAATDFQGSVDLSGGCLFVWATADELAPHVENYPGLEISLHVTPSMNVVGGHQDELGKLSDELSKVGWFNWLSNIPPIHTSSLAAASVHYSRALTEVPVEAEPRYPIYSATVAGPLPDDVGSMLEIVGEFTARPALIWQMLERAVHDGVRNVVECGPAAHYSVFGSMTEGEPHVALSTDVVTTHPLTQMQTVAAELFAAGAVVNPSGLFVNRVDQGFDLDGSAVPAAGGEHPRVTVSLGWHPIGSPGAADHGATAPGRTATAPFIGTLARDDTGAVINTLTLDLVIDRYAVDHSLIADDGRPSPGRFPLLPGSFVLEAMAETAAAALPGRGVVELTDVGYERWFNFDADGRLTVTFRATPSTSDAMVVEASVGGRRHATATVHFGDEYTPARALQWSDPVNPQAFPGSVADLYQPREMFHGPLLQPVVAIDFRSDTVVEGRLQVTDPDPLFALGAGVGLAIDPVIVDGATHLIGAWGFGADLSGYPTAIESIGIHGPRPAPGTVVPCRMEVIELTQDPKQLRAQMEVGDGAGGQWLTIVGFVDQLFAEPEALSTHRATGSASHMASRLQLPGLPPDIMATVVPGMQLSSLDIQVLERSYLAEGEGNEVQRRRARRDRLGGRIAAKAAIMLDPRNTAKVWEITISRDLDSAPQAQASGHWAPKHLSVGHTDWGAAAVVGDVPVGIDIESADVSAAREAFDFVTESEAAELARLLPGLAESQLSRVAWCTKEAASKAAGVGLQGRPLRWVLGGADEHGRLVCVDTDSGLHYLVALGELEGATVAVAYAAPESVTSPVHSGV